MNTYEATPKIELKSLDVSPFKSHIKRKESNNLSSQIEISNSVNKGKVMPLESKALKDKQKDQKQSLSFKIYRNLTKRLLYQRRISMQINPILIIVFDGLIGEYQVEDN